MQLIIADFVAFLIFTIIWHIFLDCVIGKMNFPLIRREIVLRRRGSNITFPIPIPFQYSIDTSYHHIMPEIKFPLVIEKWFLYVGLHNISSFWPICILLLSFDNCFNLIKTFTNFYAIPTVWVLTWFDYPSALLWFTSSFRLFVSLVVVSEKFEVIIILYTFLYVKSMRKVIKNVIILFLIIQSHSFKQCFFIANNVVINKMIVHFLLLNLGHTFDDRLNIRLLRLLIFVTQYQIFLIRLFLLGLGKLFSLSHRREIFISVLESLIWSLLDVYTGTEVWIKDRRLFLCEETYFFKTIIFLSLS